MIDNINPDHYKRLPAEAIEIIEAAIDNAPSNRDAYLHGQVLKYVLRCWNKNGIEDLRKAQWSLNRLIKSLEDDEDEVNDILQSLKDHPFGKLKQPAWTPKVGDWVKIKKPSDTKASWSCWFPETDMYNGQIIKVKEVAGCGVVHDGWGFLFDWLEPAEQPKAPLNSDEIPEGYRKLNDSSEEPRQHGDLRWSIAEKRYIEISGDEIGYANRDNWAACRKVEPVIKQSLNTEPPDGWRFLDVGEVIRKGDRYFDGNQWKDRDWAVKETYSLMHQKTIRRNRFEVSEKVVDCRTGAVSTVQHTDKQYPIIFLEGATNGIESKHLAPYIEDAKHTGEATVEATGEVKPPDGWRWLEVGEVIRKGDRCFTKHSGSIDCLNTIGEKYETEKHFPTIRRNRFEVGEKVVDCRSGVVFTVQHFNKTHRIVFVDGVSDGIESKHFAPYIEDAK